jgi:cation:H+ antiporter
MTYGLLILGFVLLVGGAEVMVRGAGAVAVRFGLSPVVVGLTVVAFGTSAPELAVSVGAARDDQAGLAIGNVVGSNIANVLLVLGASAVVGGGLLVTQKLVRIDVPIMVGASALVLVMSLDGSIGRVEGIVLFAGIVAYTWWTVRTARREDTAIEQEYEEAFGQRADAPLWIELVQIVGGVALLVIGSQWLVSSASEIARDLGVSDLVVGLTVVAIGTSAPELATSIVAALKGERDIAVGNAVGSNLFNLLSVLGLTALVAPSGVAVSDDALRLDMPIMLAVAVACLPVFFNGYLLKRWEGALFVLYYLAYICFLALDSIDSGLRDPFAIVMVVFVAPLTLVTLAVISVRSWKAHRAQGPAG